MIPNLALSMNPFLARMKESCALKERYAPFCKAGVECVELHAGNGDGHVGMWWCNANRFLTMYGDKYLSPPLFFIVIILNDKADRENNPIFCLPLCGHWLAVHR